MARQYERYLGDLDMRREHEAGGGENGWESWDEDELEMARIRYRKAHRELSHACPELQLNMPELLDGVPPNESNSYPCPCGHGRVMRWPWMVDRETWGFCGCDDGLREKIALCSAWVPDWMGW